LPPAGQVADYIVTDHKGIFGINTDDAQRLLEKRRGRFSKDHRLAACRVAGLTNSAAGPRTWSERQSRAATAGVKIFSSPASIPCRPAFR